MSNVFEMELLSAIYEDENMSVVASYTPPAGIPITIRVQDRRQGVSQGDGGGPKASIIVPEIWVRHGDVADPPTGGTLVLDGTTYTIIGVQKRLNGSGIATGELRLTVKKA